MSLTQSQDILLSTTLILLLTSITFLIDLFLSGLYPILVNQALKKRVSWTSALFSLKKKLWQTLSSGAIAWAIAGTLSIMASIILLSLNMSKFSWIISFAISFAFIFFSYFLFPTIIFKEAKTIHTLKDTFFKSLKNKKTVFFYSFIPVSISIVKFILAFFVDTTAVLWLFWFIVIFTGIIYSIRAVANQLLYERFYNKAGKNNEAKNQIHPNKEKP